MKTSILKSDIITFEHMASRMRAELTQRRDFTYEENQDC